MRKKFIPSYYSRDFYQKLQTLTQGSRSVEYFYKDIEATMLRANIQEGHEATMVRFLNGLKLQIVKRLELYPYVEIGEIIDKVVKIEQRLKRRGQPPSNYACSTPPPMPNQPMSEQKQLAN